mmetsp:Transcript_18999/g.13794  ORF Transcript_18999/g.13794 Transcript_18999/m.13794 type:complete len:85 (+) Transcript_18999:378-632(+)
MIELTREKKKNQANMALNIYNQVKQVEEHKESNLESQIQQQEVARRQLEKDALTQEESMKKRLYERQKSRDVARSMSHHPNTNG